jgi:hypothetical protein
MAVQVRNGIVMLSPATPKTLPLRQTAIELNLKLWEIPA